MTRTDSKPTFARTIRASRYSAPKFLTVALVLMISGCASISYITDNYHGVAAQEVVMQDDTYRVFDRPEAGKMMITSSIGSAARQGMVRGLLLMAVDATPPKVLFRAAADQFIVQGGRTQCHVTDGDLLISPQYEFRYSCAAIKTSKIQ